MSESEYPEPDPSLSRDATHSTYAPAAVDPEENPPLGTATEQTLGVPAEVAPTSRSSSKAKAASE